VASAVALVTGAGGEMGHALVPALVERGFDVAAFDLKPLPEELRRLCREAAVADLLDEAGMAAAFARHRPSFVFHLAAVLSAHAERDWYTAHRVNVEGTLRLFRSCVALGGVRFLFPSSIAVYGLPDARTKEQSGAVHEGQWTSPRGVYGANKLYCEGLGTRLAAAAPGARLDFRSIRFPGLISAETLPSGGTTDYAPAMIHAAAQHRPYRCFVGEASRLPFMTMPDAVGALLRLAGADESRLARRVYNVRGFSCSAGEIRQRVADHFPDARIDFDVDPARQAIVDSWPADVDDSAARRDWGLAPVHGLAEAFGDYLLPALGRRYATTG
jgi:nucleoside-diphosphate-sugar epimerase